MENLTKADMKIRRGREGQVIKLHQNFIFRYYHKLDAKHVTTSN